jgi:hypothetical protein
MISLGYFISILENEDACGGMIIKRSIDELNEMNFMSLDLRKEELRVSFGIHNNQLDEDQ